MVEAIVKVAYKKQQHWRKKAVVKQETALLKVAPVVKVAHKNSSIEGWRLESTLPYKQLRGGVNRVRNKKPTKKTPKNPLKMFFLGFRVFKFIIFLWK